MKLGIYSMRDRLTGYLQPSFDLNDAVALRNFEAAILQVRPGNLLHTNPEDYALYKLGDFDSDSGVITPMSPLQIATGSAVILKSLKEDSADV